MSEYRFSKGKSKCCSFLSFNHQILEMTNFWENLQGKSPKKRKLEEKFVDSKNLKIEESPFKAKKPIRLKKTIHPRKKLQSNQDSVSCRNILILVLINPFQILEEDASSTAASPGKRKSRNGIDYDDVYTRKGKIANRKEKTDSKYSTKRES